MFQARRDLLPGALALGGLALMFSARHLTALQHLDRVALYCAMFFLWLGGCVGLLLHAAGRGVSLRRIGRISLVLALFMLGMFPRYIADGAWMLTRTTAMLGLVMLVWGLLRWRRAAPALTALHRLLAYANAMPRWLYLGALALLFFCVAAFLEGYLFARFPVYTDSIAQYVHAKVMAEGKLYEAAHPFSKFFYIPMSITADGKLYSQYEPVHVFLLALGFLAGAPWLVNPAVGALTLIVVYFLARRLTDEPSARIAALFFLLSPFIVVLSSEYMNHSTALLFGALAMLALVEMFLALKAGRQLAGSGWALAAGLSLSAAILTRPFSGLGIAMPFLAYLFWRFCRRPARYFVPGLIIALCGVACVLFQAWYNLRLTGDIFILPYAKYSLDNIPRIDGDHTLWRGLLKGEDEWLRMNNMLFEWAVPCTLFVALACLRPLRSPYLRLLVVMLFCYSALNLLNPFKNVTFGPRYLYELTPALLILTAMGIRRLPGLMVWAGIPLPERRITQATIAVALAVTFGSYWVSRLPDLSRQYRINFFDNHPEFYRSLVRQAKTPALIFIARRKREEDDNGRYRWVAHENPPRDDSPIIFALDLGPERDPDLMQMYPGRHAYLERGGKLYPIDPETFRSDAPDAEKAP